MDTTRNYYYQRRALDPPVGALDAPACLDAHDLLYAFGDANV